MVLSVLHVAVLLVMASVLVAMSAAVIDMALDSYRSKRIDLEP